MSASARCAPARFFDRLVGLYTALSIGEHQLAAASHYFAARLCHVGCLAHGWSMAWR